MLAEKFGYNGFHLNDVWLNKLFKKNKRHEIVCRKNCVENCPLRTKNPKC